MSGIEPPSSACLPAIARLSGIPESNWRLFLGKEAYYHYTNPARSRRWQAGEADIITIILHSRNFCPNDFLCYNYIVIIETSQISFLFNNEELFKKNRNNRNTTNIIGW